MLTRNTTTDYVCISPAPNVRCANPKKCPGICKKLCGPKANINICPKPKTSKCVPVPKEICNPKVRTDCPTYCVEEEKQICGTLSGIQCPKGKRCVDDPNGCPIAADCPGICVNAVKCGGLVGTPCPKGQTCVDDPSDSCGSIAVDCPGICV